MTLHRAHRLWSTIYAPRPPWGSISIASDLTAGNLGAISLPILPICLLMSPVSVWLVLDEEGVTGEGVTCEGVTCEAGR